MFLGSPDRIKGVTRFHVVFLSQFFEWPAREKYHKTKKLAGLEMSGWVRNEVTSLQVIDIIIWLAPRVGKMNQILRCDWLPGRQDGAILLAGSTRRVPQGKSPRKQCNKSFIDQACSIKMAGYWTRSFFESLWTETESRSINSQKKNLANIQPSWPHTWSITHIYHFVILYMKLEVQSKHDDSGDTNSVLSFYFEYSADGALWEHYTANGANKVPS